MQLQHTVKGHDSVIFLLNFCSPTKVKLFIMSVVSCRKNCSTRWGESVVKKEAKTKRSRVELSPKLNDHIHTNTHTHTHTHNYEIAIHGKAPWYLAPHYTRYKHTHTHTLTFVGEQKFNNQKIFTAYYKTLQHAVCCSCLLQRVTMSSTAIRDTLRILQRCLHVVTCRWGKVDKKKIVSTYFMSLQHTAKTWQHTAPHCAHTDML